jgi:uncharacterized protein (DUF885 family)
MERREFLIAGSAAAISAGMPMAAQAAWISSADMALRALMDRIFYDSLAINPERASSIGLDRGVRAQLKSRLDDYGDGQRFIAREMQRKAAADLKAMSPDGLSPASRRNRENAIYGIEQQLLADKFGLASVQRPYPIFQQGGAYFGVPDFLDSQHSIATSADCEAYLSRLSAFRFALDDNGAYQKEQAARGYLAPGWSLDLTIGQMKKLRAPAPEQSGMVRSLAIRAAAKGIAGDWAARAAKIVADEVYPAIDRQIALMTKLRPTAHAGDGLWRVPQGEAIYAAALAQGTTTSLTPDEVHKIGLDQVADLQARLDVVLKAAGYTKGSVGERLTALNTSPDQLYPPTDEGRAALIASLNAGVAAMRPKLQQAFSGIPNQPLDIRRVPPDIQDGASNGYYYRAPLDGSRPAIYWINLKDVGDWPKYQLPSLTYHEGIPGHHLQLGYAQTSGDIPMLLRGGFYSAYSEGWALYAEQMSDELGGYSGIEKAGYLQSFLFRAARLVVDTGIHAKRWSRKQATDYLVTTTGFTRPRSQREVERYCTQAGQACSYKIGHNMWLKLRMRAQAKLGAKFTLPWFHDVLTEGAMPLAMLERRVDERIAEALGAE